MYNLCFVYIGHSMASFTLLLSCDLFCLLQCQAYLAVQSECLCTFQRRESGLDKHRIPLNLYPDIRHLKYE